jgi:2-hydroxymuconate-semialdehyde hydrolase
MTFSKNFIELPFGIMAYVKAGEAPDAVVLLHGIPTSSYLWRNVIPLLQDDFTVYAPDMLGYGDSDKPEDEDLSISAQADYLKFLADALGLGKFHLAGHDIGGGVAQIFAVRYPGLLEKLVLIDTIAYDSWPEPSIDRLKDPSWDEKLKLRDLRVGFRKGFEGGLVHQERISVEMLEGYIGPFTSRQGRINYLRAARALKTSDLLDMTSKIERIPHETLILWGEKDPFQDVSYGKRLAEALKKARLLQCDDGSHFLPEDRPDWVADKMRSFFRK